jgi:hypothetical protein
MRAAVAEMELLDTADVAAVEIKATLGLPRYEGVVDVVRGHPQLTNRKGRVWLDCVAYKREEHDGAGFVLYDTVSWYGMVYALGTVTVPNMCRTDFVVVRCFKSTEPRKTARDAARLPLTLRPLHWEQPLMKRAAAPGTKKPVNTVPGFLLALPIEALTQKVCIVPNYLLGGDNFLVNDLVNIAPDELMLAAVVDDRYPYTGSDSDSKACCESSYCMGCKYHWWRSNTIQ